MERLLTFYRASSSRLAMVLLVVVNLVPLAGVLWWGWDLWSILVLYWVENGIVGAVNMLKVLLAEGPAPIGGTAGIGGGLGARVGVSGRIGLALFFSLHYGIFWIGHGLFVLLFLPMMATFGDSNPGPTFGPFSNPAGPDWSLVWAGAAGLALSHGASFALNFIGRREYRTVSPLTLMGAPYARVFVLQVTIILGGMLTAAIGAPIGALVVLVLAKIGLDLGLHLREHRARAVTGSLPDRA